MTEKAIVRGLLAAGFAVVMTLAESASASVSLPTGLTPGQQYQIAFITDVTTDGQESEAYYNTFVSNDVSPALSALLPSTVTWTAITSVRIGTTSTYITAAGNAPSFTDIPVYGPTGTLVMGAGLGGLYGGSALTTPIDITSGGDLKYDYDVWTGSNAAGGVFYPLGQAITASEIGNSDATNSQWIHDGEQTHANHSYLIYALSSPITYENVPEPTTLTVWALLGLAGVFYLRRAAKA